MAARYPGQLEAAGRGVAVADVGGPPGCLPELTRLLPERVHLRIGATRLLQEGGLVLQLSGSVPGIEWLRPHGR